MQEKPRRRPTMKDIADAIGVTVTTVSKSLRNHPDVSPPTRERVLAEIRRQNYVANTLARSLRSEHSGFVPVIVTDIANPYFAEVIEGAESVLKENGYDILIFDTKESSAIEASIIAKIIGINPAGVIITPARSTSTAPQVLRDAGIRYVLTNRYIEPGVDNYVGADDVRAAYLATRHLIGRPSSRVFFVNGPTGISCTSDRLKGYRQALADHRISYDPEFVLSDCNDQRAGYAAARKILSEHQAPLSILAYSDFVASGVLHFAFEAGVRIPGSVAVMGIDNIDLYSFTHPSLSTVALNTRRIGSEAAALLVRHIGDHRLPSEQIVLEPELIVRESA